MVNLPLRNVGRVGLIRDSEPWDEPWEAWSAGTNVRFDDGKAQRSPIYRTLSLNGTTFLTDLAQVVSYRPPAGYDVTLAVDSAGRVAQVPLTGASADLSGPGYTPVVASTQFTSAFLAGCFYLNRETGVPRVLAPSASTFVPVPNWPATYTANIFRTIQSFAVGFNITKAGVNYGNLVKWSDATAAGQPASAWDPTVTTSLAGENALSQIDGPILDAQNLGNAILIYSARQCWVMEPTGDKTFVFNFRKLWEDPSHGVWGRNCSLEVNGKHYVFGQGDIYTHDGNSAPVSIAAGKVRKFIYSTMLTTQSSKFFVAHDPFTTSVLFFYAGQDADVKFPGATGCNKVAVFNYQNETWGFMEAPNVSGACLANAALLTTWATDTKTWAASGGSWLDQADGAKVALLMSGNTLGTLLPRASILALDPISKLSRIGLPPDPYANTPAYLEHGGVSLDQAGLPLQNYKRVRSVNIQARVTSGGALTVSTGASALPPEYPAYTSVSVFDPGSQYFVPSTATGRYVALRIDADTLTEFDVTGFDLDVVGGGKR